MKVLLVQPRPRDNMGYKNIIATEPLGLEIVAASLLKEHEVQLLDIFFNSDTAVEFKKFKPHAVGISCSFSVDVYQTIEIAREIKSLDNNTFVFVGGHHATLNYSDFNDPAIDAVVTGEGETTTPELLRTLEDHGDLYSVPGLVLNINGEQHFTGERELLNPLDDVPMPARELLGRDYNKYFLSLRQPLVSMETIRGCPYRCNFCSVWCFYRGKVRKMSAERVVEELSRLPATHTLITDDNFFADVNRADKIATLLQKEKIPQRKYIIQARSDTIINHPDLVKKWKEVGLDQVFIGFEKISQEELDQVGKRNDVENNEKAFKFLRSIGVRVTPSFIVDPGYTKKDFQELADYLKRLKINEPQISILTPLPGTTLYEEVKDQIISHNYELYDLQHTVLPTKLPLEEFYEEYAKLFKNIYLTPGGIFNMLRWFVIRGIKGNLSFQHLRNIISTARLAGNPRAYLSPDYYK